MPDSAETPVPLSTHQALRELVDRARAFGSVPRRFRPGEVLMAEEEANTALWILISGTVRMSKTGTDGVQFALDELGPGSLLGILSFWTGRPSFSESRALTEVECLELDKPCFEDAVREDPEFSRLTLQLLVANLSDRYRRVVGLNLKVEGLTRELESERNALREAVADLKATRNQLVHKEKLATMGQLLAGIAHEINNPSSSLMKSVEQLERDLPALLEHEPERLRLFRAGQEAAYLGAEESRDRMRELQRTFPTLSRPLARRLARFPEPAAREAAEKLERGRGREVEEAARVFDLGAALRSIRVADERITRLVRSLKSYSRQDADGESTFRLEQCVQDTLTVLNHRLKRYEVHLDLPDLPDLTGQAGEMNQILTNLLSNACDATPEGRAIHLRAAREADRVILEVADEGHGVPGHLLHRIFEPNVTTKSGGGQYGLGLGLAISRDLAEQVDGALTVRNREEGGAVFRLEWPLAAERGHSRP